jgi:DNA-binding transcriptional ArsR family regulator
VLFVYGCVGKVITPMPSPNDALAGLLGHTRAAVLRQLLHDENSTGAVARRLALSPASVSEHIRALREAGLATSTRRGRTVDHHPTALGRSLLDVNSTRQPRLL